MSDLTWSDVECMASKSIKNKARQYTQRDFYHYVLNYEDLIGEGWQVYAEILKAKPELEPNDFWLLFQKSLSNHFKQLLDFHLYTDKRGMKDTEGKTTNNYLDLSEVSEYLGAEGLSEMIYIEYVDEVKNLIKEDKDLLSLFTVMVDPNEQIEELCWIDQLRKCQLQEQGKLVYGAAVCTPTNKQFRIFLGWSEKKFNANLLALKKVILNVMQDFKQSKSGTYNTFDGNYKVNCFNFE